MAAHRNRPRPTLCPQALTQGLTAALLTLLLLGPDSSRAQEQAALALRCGATFRPLRRAFALGEQGRGWPVRLPLMCYVGFAQAPPAAELPCRRCGAGDLMHEAAELARQLAAVAAVTEAVCAQWYRALADDLL